MESYPQKQNYCLSYIPFKHLSALFIKLHGLVHDETENGTLFLFAFYLSY